jgi:undecaprenyl pyrophosphate phosphatase UppP
MSEEEIDYSIVSLLWPHIGPEEIVVEEETEFMKIMVKILGYLNAPITLLFLFKQDILPNMRLYQPLPPNEISFIHRIWMVILIAFIPSFLLGFNYKNKKNGKTRRYINSICIWVLMFAVLVLLYSKPYTMSKYALGFLFIAPIIIYAAPL